MASSGRSTPLAREKEAQPYADQDTAASPLQSSTSQMVESSTADTTRREPEPTAPSPIDSEAEHDEAAGPQSQSNATADAATTTEIREKEGPRTSRSSQTPSDPHSWRSWPIVRNFLPKFALWLLGGEVEVDREDYKRYIRISYKVDNNDVSEYALASFDTQCPGDWISAPFVKNSWDLDFSSWSKTCVGNFNGIPVYSRGHIELAWSSRDNRSKWLPGKLSFKPKTYRATFEVIDTDDWDVMIGQESINQHKLVTLNNRIFGSFEARRPVIRQVTQAQAANSQAEANARRAEAERLRSEADQQSAHASTSTSTTATNDQ